MSRDSAQKAVYVTIRGRVQGVGFRFFVREWAESLGITGWVRNSPDGRSVELVVEGDSQDVDRLLEQLNAGPPGARVEQVESKCIEPQGNLRQFEIRR